MKTIKIATWNVNSIRARMDNFVAWVSQAKPDILFLQEVKCGEDVFPAEEISLMGYNSVYVGQKSYNGVAILSKYPIDLESKKLLSHDDQARYVEGIVSVDGKVIRLASVYVPQGGGDLAPGEKLENSERFKYKLEFIDKLKERMEEVLKFDEFVVFGGDINVAHKDIDIHNPKSLRGTVGFTATEQNRIDQIINAGYFDSFRGFYPEKTEYTWWDYRRGGWLGNRGWRIDYMLANKKLLDATKDCIIHREVRATEKPSDHVPVEIVISL